MSDEPTTAQIPEAVTFACPSCDASSIIHAANPAWEALRHEPGCLQAALPLLERQYKVTVEEAQ